MAATGYTPISLYYSTTASAVPTAGNLANGELALNIADMKLYAKNSAGTVTLLASNASTTGVDSLSFGSTGLTPSTATTGAITVAGTLATTNGGTGLTSFTSGGVVYASSTSALTTGSALQFDGTNLGVGVTPQAKLNVQYADSAPTSSGTITSGALFQYSSGGVALNMGSSSGGYVYFNSAFANNAGVGQAYRFYQGTTQSMVLDASGNFMVGTTTPIGRVTVVGGGVHAQTTVATGAPDSYADGAGLMMSYVGGVGTIRAYSDTAGTGSTSISFFNNGAQRFVFGTSGEFGIGATPSYGTSGQVLTSAGSGAAPTWSTPTGVTTGKSIAMAMIFGF